MTVDSAVPIISCANSLVKRAIRKCMTVMRQKVTLNKKMLSVVSAGAAVGVGGMDRRCSRGTRELAAARDRQVRMQSVRTDMAKNLPPMIPMSDGEEHPCHSRLHLRDSEQEAEIYQRCVKPPPNRTVLESDSPPPYRSSSAGLLGSSSSSGSSSSGSDWSASTCNTTTPYVIRCHSMSSSSSTSKRADQMSNTGQKTDFLQRTVKRFTGKKNTTTQNPHQQQPAQHHQHDVPVVIVPRQTSNSSTSRPKPSV